MPPQEAIDRGKALYHTYFRQCQAIRNYLIGQGVPDVGYEGKGYERLVTIPGLNVRVRTNLRRDFTKKGRNKVIEQMTADDPRPLLVFEVPTYAEEPEEILVTMPIDTFVHLMQRKP